MRKIAFIASSVLVVAVGAAGVAMVSWMRAQDQAPESEHLVQATRKPMDTNAPSLPETAETDVNRSTNSLKVVGASTSNALSATGQPSPSPEDFSQYEQYRTAQTVMYGDIKAGTGTAVANGSKLLVNYRGWLTAGELFDDTYAKGKAFGFTAGGHTVIPGFEEGVMGMKVGGKRRIIIPPGLGYGDSGSGPIPAGSVLVFDVELLDAE